MKKSRMQFCQEITNKDVWEGFLDKCEEKTFLQCWNWGEFWQKMGNKIWRLGVCDNNGYPISIILAVKVEARRGTYLLAQHAVGISETLLNKLKKIAKEEDCSFVRVAPLLPRNIENKKLFTDLGFRESPMHASAYEATWKLDITSSEDELLKNMRKTTRYLIRQAEKNPDIEIEKSASPSDLEIYQKLNREVGRRQKFVPFSDEYIKNEFEVFSKPARIATPASAGWQGVAGGDGEAMWFFGKYKGGVAAGALVIFWSGIGFYHQAASLAKYAKFSIPYLLQWEAIKEAKRRGCKLYDFWGYVDPKLQPKHPWAGPTLFKMGFGGRTYEYVKTHDLPVSKKYWLTYIFEKARKIRRGL